MARAGLITRGIIAQNTEGVTKKATTPKTKSGGALKTRTIEEVKPKTDKKKGAKKAATPPVAAETTHISNLQNNVTHGDNDQKETGSSEAETTDQDN